MEIVTCKQFHALQLPYWSTRHYRAISISIGILMLVFDLSKNLEKCIYMSWAAFYIRLLD